MLREKNDQIYTACERIRLFVFAKMGCIIMKGNTCNTGSAIKTILDNLVQGSDINSLIDKKDWENLFKNQEWLVTLSLAQNLNSISERSITFHLKIIQHHFQNETKGYLLPLYH